MGIVWSLVYVQFKPSLVPENYYIPLELEGVVVEEPKLYRDSITSFIFKTEYLHGKQLKKTVKVKLFNSEKLRKPIELKDRYKLRTKLKIPHGYRNDGGMDLEKYYFFKGILGVGEAKEMIFLSKDKLSWRERLIIKVRSYLKKYPLNNVIVAITLGDISEIEQEIWKIIQVTGIGFLIAISGLHINVLFGFVQQIINFLFRFSTRLTIFNNDFNIARNISFLLIFIYCYLAGFNIPIQRAVFSLLMRQFKLRYFLSISEWLIWKISMTIVLLINPISVLSISFWLSFGSVAVLIILQEFYQFYFNNYSGLKKNW